MLRLDISRAKTHDEGTPGDATLSTGFTFDTLELPWRDNRRGESCIKADTYKAWAWFSDHFNRVVIRLEDKHERQDCLIHMGNFAGDTTRGFSAEIRGCTLVGSGYAKIPNKFQTPQYAIVHSRSTLDALIGAIHVSDPTQADRVIELPSGASEGYHDLEITYTWSGDNNPE